MACRVCRKRIPKARVELLPRAVTCSKACRIKDQAVLNRQSSRAQYARIKAAREAKA